MAPIITPAIVIHTFPYGDTSKIVRLATPELGVVSAVARGALRAKSRFGAFLQPLSEGAAHLFVKKNRDLQTLTAFDVSVHRAALATDVRRYATAMAMAELVLRCSSEEPHREAFTLLRNSLDLLARTDPDRVAEVGLTSIWRLVVVLGFAPVTDACAVDGRPIQGELAFSVTEGGFLCSVCARSREVARLSEPDVEAIRAFLRGEVPDPLPPRHGAAHRRLLGRFVRRHLAEGRDLHALDLWERGP